MFQLPQGGVGVHMDSDWAGDRQMSENASKWLDLL